MPSQPYTEPELESPLLAVNAQQQQNRLLPHQTAQQEYERMMADQAARHQSVRQSIHGKEIKKHKLVQTFYRFL